MQTIIFALILSLAGLSSMQALAGNTSDYKFTASKLTGKSTPRYPSNELHRGKEGWVILSYVVDKNGKVIDPIVEDSSGQKSFEKSAIKAAKKLKYQAATLNGQPVQQCINKVKMSFSIHGGSRGASRRFARTFNKVAKHLNKGEIAQAEQLMTKLDSTGKWNLYEDAWYWYLKSKIAAVLKQDEQHYQALIKAIAYEGNHIPNKLYIDALKGLYLEQVKRQYYGDAFTTISTLTPFADKDSNIGKLIKHSQQLKAAIDENQAYPVNGSIAHGQAWTHKLYRREFSFDIDSGKLQSFEIRCDRKRRRFDIGETQTWKVPARWGECTIYVHGEDNTEFKLYEHSPQAVAGGN